MWVAPEFAAARPERVVVIAIGPDEQRRQQFEDALAARFHDGVASHALLPFKDLVADRERTRAFLLAHGFDGAAVVRLVGIKVTESPMPKQAPVLHDSSGNLWRGPDPSDYLWSRDYVVTERRVELEVRGYAIGSGALLFSAMSETFDPKDPAATADALFDAVRRELAKRGLR